MKSLDDVVSQTEGTATTLTSLAHLIPTNKQLADFYGGLKPELAAELQRTAVRIHNRNTLSYLETGRDLLAIKEKLEHGQFHEWLAAELNMHPRQAQRLMAAAELWTKYDNLSHFPQSIVYRLSAPCCPQRVRQDFLEHRGAVERPSVEEVAAAIAAAKPLRTKAAKSCSRTKPVIMLEDVTPEAPSNAPAAPGPRACPAGRSCSIASSF